MVANRTIRRLITSTRPWYIAFREVHGELAVPQAFRYRRRYSHVAAMKSITLAAVFSQVKRCATAGARRSTSA